MPNIIRYLTRVAPIRKIKKAKVKYRNDYDAASLTRDELLLIGHFRCDLATARRIAQRREHRGLTAAQICALHPHEDAKANVLERIRQILRRIEGSYPQWQIKEWLNER